MRRLLAIVIVVLLVGAGIQAHAGVLKLGDPPIASLITIGPPDAAGIVHITGAAGAVFPGAQVAIRNLYTEQVVYTQAGLTGAFDTQLYGPGNTPFWISPADSIPTTVRDRPGSLPTSLSSLLPIANCCSASSM